MPEEPTPPAPPPLPRPVIPIPAEELPWEAGQAPSTPQATPQPSPPSSAADPTPVMPIAEPGVMTPAPFAQVYAPSPSPPPVQQSYYPPAYPPASPPGLPEWPAPPTYSRPGIMTFLMVSAIVVSALSVLTSFFSGCTSVAISGATQRAGARAAAPAPAAQVTVGPNSNGLGAGERDLVIRALRSRMRTRLTPQREIQLDGFLAEHGREIFDGDSLANKSIPKLVAQVGQEFATPGSVSPDFFVLKDNLLPGRLILKDDAAIFKPDDYSPNLTSHTTQPPADDPSAAPATSPPSFISAGLDSDQAQAILNRVQALGNGKVRPAQLSTLNSLMQSPSCANWISNSSTIPGLIAQVKSTTVRANGAVTITFTMGKIDLDPQGNLVGPIPPPPTFGAPAIPSTGPSFTMGTLTVDKSACTMGIIDAVASGLIAIFLMVIAILGMRPSGAPRTLFLIYALIKIACGIIAIVAFTRIQSTLAAGYDPNGVARSIASSLSGMARAAGTFSAIGLAYPVAVLLILTLSKTARDYYKSHA